MFVINFFYLVIFSLLWWGYCGCIAFYYVLSKFREAKQYKDITEFPTITIIIPCYNEEGYVEQKIANLKQLDYPTEKWNAVFLDGCSTDATVSRIEELTKNTPTITVKQTGQRGKINQINAGLQEIDSEIVVNTDVDAELEQDVLFEIVKEFQADENVGVVGALVSPKDTIPLEEDYWLAQNRMRVLESRFYSSSIVVAPCYAFRREVFDGFTDDVIADDIFLPFTANLKGYKTVYSERARAYETRSPKSFSEWLPHKFRKSNAYLVELLRFLYRVPEMTNMSKIVYFTKLMQFVLLPWLLAIFLLLTISLLWLQEYELIVYFAALSVPSLLAASNIMRHIKVGGSPARGVLPSTFMPFLLANVIVVFSALAYPFYSQTSSYKKIETRRQQD